LTDQSKKQLLLEKIYKKDIGQPNKKLKKVDYQNPRKPSSTKNNPNATKKVGVLTNDELPKQIVYFLEARSYQGSAPIAVYPGSSQASAPLLQVQPGELIKVVDTPAQYIHKMRMDRDNQGLWKNIKVRDEDPKGLNVYYDWRNFETITSHDFPVELDILVPYGKNSIPVFSKPGSWTWKDCGLSESLCLDNIDLHTKAYLFDATIVNPSQSASLGQDYRLFYKVGYQLKDKNGITQHRVGWIPSTQAKRKISQLTKSLLATRTPGSFGSFESDEERMRRLQKYYVFKANMTSDNKSINRWLASAPGKTTEVFFQNIAIDGLASAGNFTLEQNFLTDKFSQQNVNVGFGIFAPIFIDLEIQGTLMGMIPLSATEDNTFEKTYLFRAEQWLLYTTPVSLSGTPLKFGVGGYYLTMFSDNRNFGFNSLVGFQVKMLFENDSFWFGTRYGPTGQDLGFRFENRELGADFGIRLDPSRKYESWSIYGDISDTSFTNPNTGNSTKFQILQLGIRKQF
ncbi:MAG: hypothetical protein MJK18_04115, partial [Bdellovibrionales bacterium]|nr:hypothetical protein [Bdellovibrionales bacterium]